METGRQGRVGGIVPTRQLTRCALRQTINPLRSALLTASDFEWTCRGVRQ